MSMLLMWSVQLLMVCEVIKVSRLSDQCDLKAPLEADAQQEDSENQTNTKINIDSAI